MKPQERMNLANLAMGAVNEAFEFELERVIENILDPNTDPQKKRKITIEITFAPDQRRSHVGLTCQAKAGLVPAAGVETSILIGRSKDGVVAQELRSQAEGQMEIDVATGEIRETGTRIEFIHKATAQ